MYFTFLISFVISALLMSVFNSCLIVLEPLTRKTAELLVQCEIVRLLCHFLHLVRQRGLKEPCSTSIIRWL